VKAFIRHRGTPRFQPSPPALNLYVRIEAKPYMRSVWRSGFHDLGHQQARPSAPGRLGFRRVV